MQKMVLGVRSQAWSKGGVPLAEQFKRIASHGFKFVNVIFDVNMSASEESEAIKAFADLGLYSGQMGVDVGTYTSEPGSATWTKWVDTGKAKVEFQSKLGGKQIVMVAGRYSTDYPHQPAWVDSVRSMQEVCDVAEQAGQVVVLEYEPEIHYVTNTYWNTLEYLSQVDRDNFMINIDIGHMHCMQTPFRAVHLLRNLVPQCHITDNDGTAHHGGPIGTGSTPIRAWMEYLEPFVAETCELIGEVPSAAIEFGGADPDAEIERIKAHLASIGVDLPLQL